MSNPYPIGDTVEQLLAHAACCIDEGIARGERVDAFDAYQRYEDDDREASPSFAAAQDALLRLDRLDKRGRSHALRATWYTRVESQNVRFVCVQTVRAWLAALDCDDASLEWQRMCAYALLRDGRGGEAVRLLGRLIRRDGEAHLYYLRGLGYQRVAKLSYARRDFARAILLDGEDWRFFAALADTYQEGTEPRMDALKRAQRLRQDVRHGRIERFGDAAMQAQVAPQRVYLDRELAYLADWYDKLGRRVAPTE